MAGRERAPKKEDIAIFGVSLDHSTLVPEVFFLSEERRQKEAYRRFAYRCFVTLVLENLWHLPLQVKFLALTHVTQIAFTTITYI